MNHVGKQYDHMVHAVFSYLIEADTHNRRILKHVGRGHELYRQHEVLQLAIDTALALANDINDTIEHEESYNELHP